MEPIDSSNSVLCNLCSVIYDSSTWSGLFAIIDAENINSAKVSCCCGFPHWETDVIVYITFVW